MKVHGGLTWLVAIAAFAGGLSVGASKKENAEGSTRATSTTRSTPSPQVAPHKRFKSSLTEGVESMSAETLVRNLEAEETDPVRAEILMARLTEIDLERAYSVPGLLSKELLQNALGKLAKGNASNALERALRAPTKDLQRTGVHVVLRAALEQNPDTAIALLQQLPNPELAHFAFTSWAKEFPDEADSVWQKLPRDSFVYGYFLNELAAAKAKQDRDAAIKWYQQHAELRQSHWALLGLARSFEVTKEYHSGADWLMTLPPSSQRQGRIKELTQKWAEEDPDAVLNWAATAPSGAPQSHAISAALSSLSKGDPAAALLAFDELPAGRVQSATARSIADQLVLSAPEIAIDWALGLEPQLRQGVRALSRAMSTWSNKNVAEAQQKLTEIMPELSDSEAAEIVKPVANFYGQHPFTNGGSEWLETLPAGPIRDAAIHEYADELVRHKPANALTWSQEIDNEELRSSLTADLLKRWRKRDPGAAAKAEDILKPH